MGQYLIFININKTTFFFRLLMQDLLKNKS